jgi:hypothetical protein
MGRVGSGARAKAKLAQLASNNMSKSESFVFGLLFMDLLFSRRLTAVSGETYWPNL